ncbi:MAG: LysE family translocator [Acidimicrobiales bacterium]
MLIDTSRLVAIVLTALAIIAVPGPSVLFVISRGVTLGRRAGLATVVGNEVGLAVQVVAVAFGLGEVVERSIVAFTVIKVCGALYLVYLGVQAIRHRRSLADAFGRGVEPVPLRRILREGFVVGVSNPKSMILFTSILPQFVDPHGASPTLQLLVLGAVCVLVALLSDSVWALAAGTARAWFGRRPERLSTIGGVGGLITIGLGLRLAVTGRHD